jgi:long-chain fatty acid transport protein
MRLRLLCRMLLAAGACTLSAASLASGYNFGSQSVSAQGTAHANGAEAADPTTIYYNPAGMSRLDGDQISIGATAVIPTSSYRDNGSTTVRGNTTGGDNGGTFAPDYVVAPNFYMTHQIDSRWHVGLGVFVPYGAALDYGNNWAGRYALEKISLTTINFNPSLSYTLDEHQSIGFGVSAQYMKASLQKAVDVKDALYLAGLTGLSTTVTGDGTAIFNADGWGYGFNLGYLYQLDDHTRFGLAYRSQVRYTLTGSAQWQYNNVGNSTAAAVAASQHSNSPASVDVVTPQSASANFYHDLTDRLALMGNVTWTGHSSLDALNIQLNGTGRGDMVIEQHWKNSWLFALGTNYKYSDRLMLRTGVAYDQSPVPSDTQRDPGLPDSERYWISLGANYKLDKHSSIDVAYSYVIFKDSNIDYTDSCSPQLASCTGNGETTKGQYHTYLQLFGLQYNYRF